MAGEKQKIVRVEGADRYAMQLVAILVDDFFDKMSGQVRQLKPEASQFVLGESYLDFMNRMRAIEYRAKLSSGAVALKD